MQENKNNSYSLKIGLFVGLGLVCFFGLFLIVGAVSGYIECECEDEEAVHPTLEYPCGSFINYSSCEYCYEVSDECSYSGQTRCYDSTRRQICGNYDSNPGLEWSSPKKCSGITSCGYGRCDSDERPYRYCSGGDCIYRCEYDSSCAKSSCECSEGPCCDGCNYRPSTFVCNSEIQTQYGCPWGLSCGADVGKKTKSRFKYCSGDSAECSESWSSWLDWTSWRIADSCGTTEVCWVGNSQCQYSSSCVSSAPEPEPEFSLKCDDGNALMLSLLGRKENSSEEWKKDVKAAPGQRIDFLLIIANSSSEDLDGVGVKVELPQEIIYRGNLKIGESSSEENISEGFNIGYLSSGAIETITFKGEVSSDIGAEEKYVVGSVNIENLSISDSTKVAFEKPKEQMAAAAATFSLKELLKKWYFWALLILGIIILFYLIKRFSSKG